MGQNPDSICFFRSLTFGGALWYANLLLYLQALLKMPLMERHDIDIVYLMPEKIKSDI